MSGEKTGKPSFTERNSLTWISKNGKPDVRRTFIRGHAKEYPKLGWSVGRTRSWSLAIIAFICAMTAFSFTEDQPVKAIATCAAMLILIILVVDSALSGINMNRFYEKQLNSGGVIIDPWNARIIKKRKIVENCIRPVIAFACLVFNAVIFINGTAGTAGLRGLPYYFWSIIILCFVINIYTGDKEYPNIFLSADVGMVFGGALFSYDTLSSIMFSGSGGEFELNFDGDTVANGVMLIDDMDGMRELILECKFARQSESDSESDSDSDSE